MAAMDDKVTRNRFVGMYFAKADGGDEHSTGRIFDYVGDGWCLVEWYSDNEWYSDKGYDLNLARLDDLRGFKFFRDETGLDSYLQWLFRRKVAE